jgi:hypothetical protein
MPETYQVTSALKYLSNGQRVALLTDGRFSGVSTGACIGHISPEAWAGGPLGKLRDGDRLRVRIDTRKLEGSIDFVPAPGSAHSAELELAQRPPSRKSWCGIPAVPDDTRLWAALQSVSGGSWGGCVFDTDRYRTPRGAQLRSDHLRPLVVVTAGNNAVSIPLTLDALFAPKIPRRSCAPRWQPAGRAVPARPRAPIQSQEVWAAGVTYLRSRTARMEESKDAGGGTFYDKVYHAERPELFFKATPHRVAAPAGRCASAATRSGTCPNPSSPWRSTRAGASSATPSATT